MKILIACERFGVVRDAFLKKGHDVISCDKFPTESPGPHHTGDVLDLLNQHWDMVIAFPPCTILCNSGVWNLTSEKIDVYKRQKRWQQLEEATTFFNIFLNLPNVEKVCIENSIMHRYAASRILKPYTQTVQPYQFGHSESKRTCLWLKGLPNLQPTNVVMKTGKVWDNQTPSGQNKLGPSKSRSAIRGKTYQGIADAMAEQWSNGN